MRTIYASETIPIGKQGENNTTRVLFDIADWKARLGEGTYALLHRRHGDAAPYPAAVTVSVDKVQWVVTSSDVEKVGIGEAELTLTISGAIAKSQTFLTVTEASLPGAGNPPAPYQSWVNDVLEAADDASEAADDASEAAEDASEAAEDAVEAREAIEAMTATAQSLPAGSAPTVTKTVAEGHVNLDFGIPAGGGTDAAAVHYTAETKTDGQKAQARTNIGAYAKPADGIPSSDMTAAVQASLALADSALQTHQDISGKQNNPSTATLTDNTTVTLADNTVYTGSGIGTLTIAYPSGDYEALLVFTTAASGAVTVTFPAGTLYIGGSPTFGNGESWEVSIRNGIVVAGKAAAS